MLSEIHESLVTGAEISLGGEWQRCGFAQAVSLALMEDRLDADGTDDAVPAEKISAVPDSYQIDSQARKVRIIEVGGVESHLQTRLDLADRLDFEGWDLDLYWVEPKTAAIFLIDGSSLSWACTLLDFRETSKRDLLDDLKRVAPIVGRVKRVTFTLAVAEERRKQGRKQLRELQRKRLRILREHVWPYWKEEAKFEVAT
jgi:hypothetical protein